MTPIFIYRLGEVEAMFWLLPLPSCLDTFGESLTKALLVASKRKAIFGASYSEHLQVC